MQNIDKPNYGNWIPRNIVAAFFCMFCISFIASLLISISIVRIILLVISMLFGALFIYMVYAYYLIGKNNGQLQNQLCTTLLDKLKWNGQGIALDIGTGSGRVAISIAKRYPSSHVTGIDYWGNPWTYSKHLCETNAEIEGVADRVTFQKASAVILPFQDGEYDVVTSNFVFHSVRVVDKRTLIKESLRVLKKGGAFAFQDLFNKQFYGDINLFCKELASWGLKEVNIIDTSNFLHIPLALRVNHMLGNSRILCGIK